MGHYAEDDFKPDLPTALCWCYQRVRVSLWQQVQSAFKKGNNTNSILILPGKEITQLGDLFGRIYTISDLTEHLETAQCLANTFKRETQEEYNDDCKCFMTVNKNATNQLTQLRNAFLRHTAARLGCLMVKSQNTSFPPPDKEHSILKSLYGQLSSCERLLNRFSFVFHTLSKDFLFWLVCFQRHNRNIYKGAIHVSI